MEAVMLLSEEQVSLLLGDLDYILVRTACNTVQLNRPQVLNAISRDPDVLLDLIEGMSPKDARWLSVPPDIIRPLITRRIRGISSNGHGGEASLAIGF